MHENSNYIMADCLIGRYIDSGPIVDTKIVPIASSDAIVGNTVVMDGLEWEILEIRDFYPVDSIIISGN